MTPREMYDDHRRRHPELYVDGPRQDSKLERRARHDPLAAHPGKARATGRVRVRFVSCRQRLCDPDNLCVKWLLDCLRYCGAIEGDEPEKISLEVTQRKVKLKSDERTELQITSWTP